MNFQFYGYTVRGTTQDDLPLALAWTPMALNAGFWLKQDGDHQSYLVLLRDDPLGLFQAEYVRRDQVRLHFQAAPEIPPRKILRALTMLVPLIEKALALYGVKIIFFTSHSPAMVTFAGKRLGYRTKPEYGTRDGQVMYKSIGEKTA